VETNEQTPDGNAYSVLAREHRLIERVLDALGRLCDEARRTRQVDGPAAQLAIHFLRDFADRTHHLKEERILFPAIAAQGYFPGCALVSDHEEGRERVSRMADAVQRAMNGDEGAIRLFVRTARSFISFLRDHIAKEDECLADVVNASFPREGHERLLEQFDEMERREVGEGAFERFAAMAQELEAKYGHRGPPTPRTSVARPET
jgi:hemerythrin-like domain-containing protein